MRPVRLMGPALLIVGLAALAVGLLRGEATLMLVVLFPVVTATGPWAVLGIILIVAGFFLSFLGVASAAESLPPSATGPPDSSAPAPPSPSGPRRRWGGVLFLGPIPVVFGSDPKLARWMLLVGLLLFAGLVVLTIIALRGI